jgi:hypothetical protein
MVTAPAPRQGADVGDLGGQAGRAGCRRGSEEGFGCPAARQEGPLGSSADPNRARRHWGLAPAVLVLDAYLLFEKL